MAVYEALSVKSEQTYTSCYCEENVWKLCEKIQSTMGLNGLLKEGKAFAVFISNDNNCNFEMEKDISEKKIEIYLRKTRPYPVKNYGIQNH